MNRSNDEIDIFAKLQNLILSMNDDSDKNEIIEFIKENALFENAKKSFLTIKLIVSIASAKPNLFRKIANLMKNFSTFQFNPKLYMYNSIYNMDSSNQTAYESFLFNFFNQEITDDKTEEFIKHFMPTNSLMESIDEDDVDKVQSIIAKSNININSSLPFLFSQVFSYFNDLNPLEYAAFKGSINSFKYLLMNKSDIDYERLLECSIAGGNIEIIHIIENQFNLNEMDKNNNLLYLAIAFMNNEFIEYIVETYQINIDTESYIKCVMFSNYEAFSILIDYDKSNEFIGDVYDSNRNPIDIAANSFSFAFFEYFYDKIKSIYNKKSSIAKKYNYIYLETNKYFERTNKDLNDVDTSDEDYDKYEYY